jgi:hypothetical protein
MPLMEQIRKILASIALHKSDIANSRVKILSGQKFNPDWMDNLSAIWRVRFICSVWAETGFASAG